MNKRNPPTYKINFEFYTQKLTGEATTIAKSYFDGSIEFFILKRILYLHVQLVA